MLKADTCQAVSALWARSRSHVGNEIPESRQEGIDLASDGCGHAVLSDQVDILPLVCIGHPVCIPAQLRGERSIDFSSSLC